MTARAYAGRATRRRPAARRRPGPRRSGTRIHWDRLGRVALTIVLAVILISYLNPLANFIHTYQDSQASKAHLARLKEENRGLHKRVRATTEPGVLETEARKQGMIRPGERAYVIHGLRP